MASQLIQLITKTVEGLNDSLVDLSAISGTQVLATAEGVWLDFLANLVGCRPRTVGINNTYNLTDNQYREIVEAKIAINNGGATASNIANVVRYAVYLTDDNDWEAVKDIPIQMKAFNAKIFIDINDVRAPDISTIKAFTPAGVGLWVTFIPDDPFIVSDEYDGDPVEGKGCGDYYDLNAGGKLAYFIT